MIAVAPSPVSTLLKRADLVFTGGLFLTVLLLIMPIPAVLLDTLLALNLGLSLLVLLAIIFISILPAIISIISARRKRSAIPPDPSLG